jgi:hypothetical protein
MECQSRIEEEGSERAVSYMRATAAADERARALELKFTAEQWGG